MSYSIFRFSPVVIIISFFVLHLSMNQSIYGQPIPKPGPNHVWVSAIKNADGNVIVPAHWRLKIRKGYTWIPAHQDESGQWITGHWKPIGPVPKGKIWVKGHVGDNGKWIMGYWRPVSKKRKAWVHGHYNAKGKWVKGHWKRVPR